MATYPGGGVLPGSPSKRSSSLHAAAIRDGPRFHVVVILLFVLSSTAVWGALKGSCSQQSSQLLPSPGACERGACLKVPLLFAAADGLDPGDASVFVLSALKYLDTRTRIVLAADPRNAKNAYLYGLQRRFDRVRVLNVSMAGITVPCEGGDVKLSVYLARFVVLRDFLAAEGGRYSVVVSGDSRDTAFQADVFARPLVQAAAHIPMVVAGTEDTPHGAGFADKTISLAEEKAWNQGWLDKCFGPASYNNTERRTIVCSGFLAGHPMAMEQLSRTVVEVFQGTCCRAEQRGLDQGILNWLVHFAPPSAKRGLRLELSGNGDVVFSMSNTAYLNAMTYDAGSLVVHAYTKQPFPAIHQFDRVPDYIPVIRGLYPPLQLSGSAERVEEEEEED